MKTDLGPNRRILARNAAAIDVEFHVWDAVEKKPLTRKVPGRLTNISPKGACLQTMQTMIDGYHLMLDDDIEGGTPLVLDLPPTLESASITLKAQVQWYDRVPGEDPFRFHVGLKFVDVSPPERKQLEDLIRSTSAVPKG